MFAPVARVPASAEIIAPTVTHALTPATATATATFTTTAAALGRNSNSTRPDTCIIIHSVRLAVILSETQLELATQVPHESAPCQHLGVHISDHVAISCIVWVRFSHKLSSNPERDDAEIGHRRALDHDAGENGLRVG